MARDKNRHEIALKLLEIYHARKSATAFETSPRSCTPGRRQPSAVAEGRRDGRADRPANPLYVAAASGTATFNAMSTQSQPAAKPDLDFDLEATSERPRGTEYQRTGFRPQLRTSTSTAKRPEPDLRPITRPRWTWTSGPRHPGRGRRREEKPSFDFDLSGLDFPSTKSAAPAAFLVASSGLGDLNPRPRRGRDAPAWRTMRWARSSSSPRPYLEIGDKDGAREILAGSP
jgi:pilus assembly protein FimV